MSAPTSMTDGSVVNGPACEPPFTATSHFAPVASSYSDWLAANGFTSSSVPWIASNAGGFSLVNHEPENSNAPPLITTAAPMRGSAAAELKATPAAVTPPSEWPITATGPSSIAPNNAVGTVSGFRNESSTNDTSVACSTMSRDGDVVTARLDRGKSGAATTKPAAASSVSRFS